ncbi:hypothetical protein WJX73_004345 [Symbiochloris irregularis]|uniref:Uncharacterized protein n=1 Tax=Symbiochloris irregularis TaxID=706552 RepID=A0AAW1PJ25_9CHLO
MKQGKGKQGQLPQTRRERPPWQALCEPDAKPGPQQAYGAAQSHVLNDDYMERFEKGFAELAGLSGTPARPEPPQRTAYLPEGHVISGAMDSKLCFWRKGSVRSDTLKGGHSGPISALAHLASAGGVLSASYDKTLRWWECSGGTALPRCTAELTGHTAPVLQLCSDGASSAASGDRGGGLVAWDLQTGTARLQIKGAHAGHVTALCMGTTATAWDCISGGQDGMLVAWDFRSKASIWRAAAHVNQAGKGAVGNVVDLGTSIGTAGADGTVSLWQPQSGAAKPVASIRLPDFPYCLTAADSVMFCGCGDGFILAISEAGGKELYRLKGNAAAVRTLDVMGSSLVAAGDDGSAVTFSFGV